MENDKQLNIIGYRGRAVPNLLYQQPREGQSRPPRRLAILLPGFGYTNDMPLMFYANMAAQNAGYDVLRVNYAYSEDPDYARMTGEQQAEWLYADAEAALQAGIQAAPGSSGDYAQVAIIGKSLGTRAMGHLLEQYNQLPPSRWVWLTPVLKDAALRHNIAKYHPRSLVVIGTADPFYDFPILGELFQATQDQVEIIENANHGLIIEGDTHASIQALTRAIEAVENFIK